MSIPMKDTILVFWGVDLQHVEHSHAPNIVVVITQVIEEELRQVVSERDSLKSSLSSLENDYQKLRQEAKVTETTCLL